MSPINILANRHCPIGCENRDFVWDAPHIIIGPLRQRAAPCPGAGTDLVDRTVGDKPISPPFVFALPHAREGEVVALGPRPIVGVLPDVAHPRQRVAPEGTATPRIKPAGMLSPAGHDDELLARLALDGPHELNRLRVLQLVIAPHQFRLRCDVVDEGERGDGILAATEGDVRAQRAPNRDLDDRQRAGKFTLKPLGAEQDQLGLTRHRRHDAHSSRARPDSSRPPTSRTSPRLSATMSSCRLVRQP